MSARCTGAPATAARPPWALEITPEDAGWRYCSLRVLELAAGAAAPVLDRGRGDGAAPAQRGLRRGRSTARRSGWPGGPGSSPGRRDLVYLPRDADVEVASAGGGRFALPGARCERRLPARHRAASDVPVELRGAGASSRQVHNFASADSFEADRLIAVEVLTPAGNWSSYPPHKHDEDRRRAGVGARGDLLLRGRRGPDGPEGGPGVAYHRVYGTPERPIDLTAEVRSGDVVLVPHGWHGPSMAAPGYDLYYLNVMAGPSPDRAWLICDDPAHAWVRATWAAQDVDPRLPFQAQGLRGGPLMGTVRLTVGQAVVRFLAQQHTERDGEQHRLVEGVLGIFGHGNVAGIGQALLEQETADPRVLPYYLARNEQGMVHTAAALRPDAQPAVDLGLHRLRRSGLDQHGHRRRARHGQPAAGAAPAERRLRHPGRDAGAAGARAPVDRRRVGQRRLPTGVALLRPRGAARAAAGRPARGDARAGRPGRDRSGHGLPAAGRAGRGLRLAGRAVRPAGLAGGPAGARARGARAGRAAAAPGPTSAGGGRRRRRYSGAGEALRAFAEAHGVPVAETQAGKGSLPYDHALSVGAVGSTGTTAAQRAGRGRRRGDRHRHAVQRLHHRVALRVPAPRRAVREPQRRRRSTPTSTPASPWSPTRAAAWRPCTRRCPTGRRRPSWRRRRRGSRPGGTTSVERGPTRSGTARCPRSPRSSAW